MAIIDYLDVTSMRYAALTLPAKALIPVLATLADKKTGLIPPHHSKLDAIAAFTGISYNATRAGLQVLHDTNRISLSIVKGHPARIIYLPVAQFSTRAGSPRGGELGPHEVESQDLLNFAPDTLPDSENQERQDPCSLNRPFKQKTTTALPVPKMLIKAMISRHGSDVVVAVISGMEKKIAAGEEIDNPGAYFRKCCQNGWEPSSKAIEEKEKIAEQRKREKERQAKQDQEQKALAAQIEKERNDPEAQARVAAAQAEFWNRLDSTSVAVTSGHARPASSFD